MSLSQAYREGCNVNIRHELLGNQNLKNLENDLREFTFNSYCADLKIFLYMFLYMFSQCYYVEKLKIFM